MNTEGSNELGGAGKRRREEGEGGSTTDRLSHLPEPIISQILSLLDTKSAVQTCTLGRAWRYAWKEVHLLDLRSDGFKNYASFFERFVDGVILLRNPSSVHWVRFMDGGRWEEELEPSLLARVIEHAISHDAQHMMIALNDKAVSHRYGFTDLFGSIANCSLKSLSLRGFHVDREFDAAGFPMLTTLHLSRCQLISNRDGGEFVFFSSFPCLKNLALSRCVHFDEDMLCGFASLKLALPHLLTLNLVDDFFLGMEISAPKLRQFILHGPLSKFSRASFPSADHADIRHHKMYAMTETHRGWEKDVFEQRLKPLFQSLRNAKSVTLGSLTIEVLSAVSELLGQQPSPFTRLECLNMYSNSIPDEVLNYFVKGSSCERPTIEYLGTE